MRFLLYIMMKYLIDFVNSGFIKIEIDFIKSKDEKTNTTPKVQAGIKNVEVFLFPNGLHFFRLCNHL